MKTIQKYRNKFGNYVNIQYKNKMIVQDSQKTCNIFRKIGNKIGHIWMNKKHIMVY